MHTLEHQQSIYCCIHVGFNRPSAISYWLCPVCSVAVYIMVVYAIVYHSKPYTWGRADFRCERAIMVIVTWLFFLLRFFSLVNRILREPPIGSIQNHQPPNKRRKPHWEAVSGRKARLTNQSHNAMFIYICMLIVSVITAVESYYASAAASEGDWETIAGDKEKSKLQRSFLFAWLEILSLSLHINGH